MASFGLPAPSPLAASPADDPPSSPQPAAIKARASAPAVQSFRFTLPPSGLQGRFTGGSSHASALIVGNLEDSRSPSCAEDVNR